MPAHSFGQSVGERAAPHASALAESLRGFGYGLEAAIADLVDNSISAKARNVWVDFIWAGPVSWMAVVDDGKGMNENALVEAMRLGTTGPLTKRSQLDLGRFGLGLKTASFSQCRCVTVLTGTRESQTWTARTWDLDYIAAVDDWILRRDITPEAAEIITRLQAQGQGTAVLWSRMDRIVGTEPPTDRIAEEHFLKAVSGVKDHLAMVFHRLLSGDSTLQIFVNGRDERHRVRPWDPFLLTHPATQATPVERIGFRGEHVLLQGFVLPHRDRLGDSQYEVAGGPSGWNAQQGFYVYRNRRLLVAGGWLGLGENRPWTREEQHALARISVQYPNTLDSDWQMDVKKSLAIPPRAIRDRMTVLARSVRELSRRVFVHRGKMPSERLAKSEDLRPWIVREGTSGPRYRISRFHPLVAQVLATPGSGGAVEALLRLVELTVPIQRIWLDSTEALAGSAPADQMHLPAEELLPVARQLLDAIRRGSGISEEAAREAVLGQEPFSACPDLATLLRAT